MVHLHFVATLSVALLVGTTVVWGQGSEDLCRNEASAVMKNCSELGQITHPNFLWFVTNGTSSNGKAPDNEATFKPQICRAEPQIGGCILTRLGALANTTCQGATAVLTAVRNFLITYDTKCAHPCRYTLLNQLRECYVTNKLSPDLFLSNRSAGHVIGSVKSDVDDFCAKKGDLLDCMQPLHDSCPEALAILSSRDFHLRSYREGVTILCRKPDVYLKGLQCFDAPTVKVEACVQKSQQAFVQTTLEARAKNWSETQYIKETCKITINQADCDLNAWSEKNHEACTGAVVGLRRELECSLLPPNCTMLQKPVYDKACDSKLFSGGGSGGGGGGGGGAGGAASGLAALPGSLLLALGLLSPLVSGLWH